MSLFSASSIYWFWYRLRIKLEPGFENPYIFGNEIVDNAKAESVDSWRDNLPSAVTNHVSAKEK